MVTNEKATVKQPTAWGTRKKNTHAQSEAEKEREKESQSTHISISNMRNQLSFLCAINLMPLKRQREIEFDGNESYHTRHSRCTQRVKVKIIYNNEKQSKNLKENLFKRAIVHLCGWLLLIVDSGSGPGWPWHMRLAFAQSSRPPTISNNKCNVDSRRAWVVVVVVIFTLVYEWNESRKQN